MIPEPCFRGILSEQSMEDYHASPGVSRSDLNLIHRSPRHYWLAKMSRNRAPEKPTAAMVFGSAAHDFILEHEKFDRRWAIWEGHSRQTKAGKQAWAEFQEANKGKHVLEGKNVSHDLAACRDALMAYPDARQLLEHSTRRIEESMFFEQCGVSCRCRPDLWIPELGLVVDLKTASDASPEGFSCDSWRRRYHVQGAFYNDGIHLTTGTPIHLFAMIVIEKKTWVPAIYYLSDAQMAHGRVEYMDDLERYTECLQDDIWPGYTDEMKMLEPPRWVPAIEPKPATA